MFKTALLHYPNELVSLYLFCLLKTDTCWNQKDTGIGHEILQKAVSTATSRGISNIRADFREKGCLGTVLEHSKKGQSTLGSIFGLKAKPANAEGQPQLADGKHERVTFGWVFENLRSIGEIVGQSSVSFKEAVIVKLLRAVSGTEGKYVCRFLSQNYKIGVAEKFFQYALCRAFSSFF